MEKNSFMDRYLTPIAVVLGALILALAYVYGGHGTAPVANQPGQQQAAIVNVKDVKIAGEPFIGDANAPVTMAFFFDYQCPFCKQFDEAVTPQLYTKYVQTGKLKIVFKGFEFLGQYSQIKGRDDSMTADEFGRAVWDLYPDKFYDWYKGMAASQDQENTGFGDQASIVAMTKAKVTGIDTDKVVALIAKNKAQYDAAISADRAEATTLGVNGTPSVIVGNGNKLFSSLSPTDFYSQISAAIDAGLK